MAYELIADTTTDAGNTYSGPASLVKAEAVINLPDQVLPYMVVSWLQGKLESSLGEQSCTLLRSVVYEDREETWLTKYWFEMYVTQAISSRLGIRPSIKAISFLPLAVLIPIAIKAAIVAGLALAIAWAISISISSITDLFWGREDGGGGLGIPMGAVVIGASVLGALLILSRRGEHHG